jgi:pyruvate,orthophosphate dikinase
VSEAVGAKFGDASNPLLVSVRSGARASMPGMMDTILNLGLNDETVEGLAKRLGRQALCLRQLSPLHSNVFRCRSRCRIMAIFEDILEDVKSQQGAINDTDLTADDWSEVIAAYKERRREPRAESRSRRIPATSSGGRFDAVFGSWQQHTRANTYRRLHSIPDSWGTAVNVQAMVFGNMGETSATGVAFTRNPSTGAKEIYGEFLVNAQGEDVVAGIRTPQPLTERARIEAGETMPSLEALMPETFARWWPFSRQLESALPRHAGHRVHDPGRQALDAANPVGKAHDGGRLEDRSRSREGLDHAGRSRLRVDPAALDQLLHPTIDAGRGKEPSSPGPARIARRGVR